MISTEIQAINIGTTQASSLYIGMTQIWSGSTPVPPLPDNMEQQEFIPVDIYEEHGDIIQPIDVTLGNIRVYSQDYNTYVDNYIFYVPNTDPTNYRYWLSVSTPRSWYVYSIEIEFDGGTEEFVGGNSNSAYSYDQVGTSNVANGKLTWNWNAEAPVRYVNFFNVADPDEYGEIGLEITKITVVAAHQTVTSINPPTVTSVSNGDGTAQVTITSGNNGLNTTIFYDYPGASTQQVYTQPFTLTEGASITDVYETYNDYPFGTIMSTSVSYTVPTPASPVTPGTYQFLPADDTPIADRQRYTVTRGGVSMTVSDGLIYLDQHYRIYAAQTITIDAGSGTITAISLEFISGYANNGTTVLTADSGTCENHYDPDGYASWLGSASSVIINTSKQIRLSEVLVQVE